MAQAPAAGWSDLPPDILRRVLPRLPAHDIPPDISAPTRSGTTAPWQWRTAYLALPDGGIFRFPDFTPRRSDDSAGYRGACDDGLLFADGDYGFLLLVSPFTGRTRLLSGLSGVRADDEPIEAVVNELAPVGQPCHCGDSEEMSMQKMVVCPDGLVAAIVGREHFAKVAVCTLEGFSWSLSSHSR